MIRATLIRNALPNVPESDGVFGKFYLHNKEGGLIFQCVSLEPPWRNNEHIISCIPKVDYLCTKEYYHNKPHYLLNEVENRLQIHIHAFNYAGDEKQIKKCESNGCIGLGFEYFYNKELKQWGIKDSRKTIEAFHMALNGHNDDSKIWQPFKLTIK